MGSATSKSVDPEAAVGRRSYYSRNVFRTSCIRTTTGSSDNSDIDDEAKKTDIECNLSNMNSSKSKGKLDRNKKVKRPRVPSETHFGEWGESSLSGSSRNRSGCSHNSSSNILSRSSNKTKSLHGCEFFPSCFMPMSARRQDDDSVCSDNTDASSIHELGSNDNNDNGMESNGTLFYPRNVEQNVRFSRTLSVGRLRDRVHNRPTFPELASFPLQSEGEVVSDVDICDMGSRFSDENVTISATSSSYSSSTMTNSLYGNHDFEVENMGARETRYTNILESRANFLERRRRIRSQVRALQRMGSRFENLSGHERSCILSGQHRTGFCTCRLINQDPNGGTDARGSISRIVLLTEALFEVLGEIRQQSIVSSSRPGLSSIGSVPTPTEVVEALPVKLYRKLSKHVNEDDAQCHICLVEYEDGDEVRVLPCHHEFHRFCIDKWLKETHRICPLCRCDVCKTGSLHDESSQLSFNGGTDARGSISRIVLLTEALFEVLGEIRHQSIVSSSRPGLSSIGSVPTPTEVVEALPVKLYRKLSKHVNEDDAQCHICLVEYEDGDEVRVLPCRHEFHRLCIDKWLKETHRICPLCRCDVCKTGSLHDESSQL